MSAFSPRFGFRTWYARRKHAGAGRCFCHPSLRRRSDLIAGARRARSAADGKAATRRLRKIASRAVRVIEETDRDIAGVQVQIDRVQLVAWAHNARTLPSLSGFAVRRDSFV